MNCKQEEKEIAKQEALYILDKYKITEPPINPIEIAKEEGLQVYSLKFDEDMKDVSGFIHHDTRSICINKLETFPPRRIFTIAHELGHYFLHKKDGYQRDISMRKSIQNIPNIYETQANIFAANLLVPKYLLDKYYEGYTITQLSMLFCVSKPVMQIRLIEEYGSER